MGTSNFFYRDTLYAQDTYVQQGECTCDDKEALAVGCEHEADCPAICGYHDEVIFDDTKECLIFELNKICSELGDCDDLLTVYEKETIWTNDARRFDGSIIACIFKNIHLDHEYSYEEGYFSLGDDLCLRNGYYSGFNFDRIKHQWADYGLDSKSIDDLKERIYEFIFEYDELRLDDVIEDGDLTEEQVQAIRDELYNKAIADIDSFVELADGIYHRLGEQYFDQYTVAARFSNGETFYKKVA